MQGIFPSGIDQMSFCCNYDAPVIRTKEQEVTYYVKLDFSQMYTYKEQ